jgi:sigma-B regulation protein RsbU (phosphoserine phosphatase)
MNTKTGELSYCNGGHNLPYIQRTDGTVEEIKNVGGLLLGKFENAPYDQHSVQLNPGDTIVTFTDGVTEAENEDKDFFDEDRLIEYLKNHTDRSLASLVKGLFLEVMKFSGSAIQTDDITVLSVQYNGND